MRTSYMIYSLFFNFVRKMCKNSKKTCEKRVNNLKKPAMPLISYTDLSAFKIYIHDVGLLRRMTDLDSSIILEKNRN